MATQFMHPALEEQLKAGKAVEVFVQFINNLQGECIEETHRYWFPCFLKKDQKECSRGYPVDRANSLYHFLKLLDQHMVQWHEFRKDGTVIQIGKRYPSEKK